MIDFLFLFQRNRRAKRYCDYKRDLNENFSKEFAREESELHISWQKFLVIYRMFVTKTILFISLCNRERLKLRWLFDDAISFK